MPDIKQRLNSEKKINNDFLNMKVGTTNRELQKVFYVNGRTFITPTEERDYEREMRKINHNVRNEIRLLLQENPHFHEGFIFNLDIPSKRMKIGKKSCLSFQCMFKQKGTELNIKNIREKNSQFFGLLASALINEVSGRGFTLSKTKK